MHLRVFSTNSLSSTRMVKKDSSTKCPLTIFPSFVLGKGMPLIKLCEVNSPRMDQQGLGQRGEAELEQRKGLDDVV